jgi:hypothetical protein
MMRRLFLNIAVVFDRRLFLPSTFKGRIICIILAVLAGAWALAQVPSGSGSLSEWMPQGALFYLESSDFGTQLRDWNRSEVQTKWLAGKNHEQFLTTRLMLKLKGVYTEFSNAAGFAPDMDALETFAGTESGLSVYDIGRLDLVYISKLPAAQLAQNSLTRVRSTYQTRTAAGQTYYVRQAGERTASFSISGDYVLVSTREDLLVQALQLMQGNASGGSVSQAAWYADAFRAMGGNPGRQVALRLVMDLPAVIRTPYFRSYWIQKNTSDFGGYSAFLSEVIRSADVFEESRVLVRPNEMPVVAHDASTTELQRFIPDDVGFVRLWDTTSVDAAMNLINEKFFAAGSRTAAPRQFAPAVALDGYVGRESDLETRIDEPPKPSLNGTLSLDALKALVDSAGLEAILHLESSLPPDDTTFVRSDAALALRASSPWNAAQVRSALTSAVASYQSVNAIGLQWHDVTAGGHTMSQWDGLIPLTVAVDGRTVWIGRSASLIASALSRSATASPQPAAYLARYVHRTELSPYLRMMRMLDLSDQPNYSSFFSDNVGSLGSALDGIQSVSVKINDDGLVQRQLVRYALGR